MNLSVFLILMFVKVLLLQSNQERLVSGISRPVIYKWQDSPLLGPQDMKGTGFNTS